MLVLKEILLISIITSLGISTLSAKEECEDTDFLVSKCDDNKKYQWVVEVPLTNSSCNGKSIPGPKSVPCDFACPRGQTIERGSLLCKQCPRGTFSVGSGIQYTFDESKDIKSMTQFSVKAKSLNAYSDNQCKKDKVWHIKGNVLQGDVQLDCAIQLVFRFKLERPGSITITYNLATHVYGLLTSRCDFGINNNDADDDDDFDSETRRQVDIELLPTGYGVWLDKQIKIDAPGEYILTLLTAGVNVFHFPFAIRSILVDGSGFLQDCIRCPPGTFTDVSGSDNCTSCPKDTYAPGKASTDCLSCANKNEYADEGSSKCLPRPICQLKDYKKVITGCDMSSKATVKYEPIQPKICIDGDFIPIPPVQQSCGSCNPGMYKTKDTDQCDFCPAKTYSNGTLASCLPCSNDLSLLTGLYYKNWNELPKDFTRNYLSFDDTKSVSYLDNSQSWIPSLTYISSQAYPNTLSALTLTISKGFKSTEMTKANKEYGTLYFQFSIHCETTCSFVLVYEDIYGNDDTGGWEIIHKWSFNGSLNHTNKTEYTYSIEFPNPVKFDWLFTSSDADINADEVRIYEIRVTNTILGGSDRCVTCLTANNQETKCKSCIAGHILSNNTCIRCPPSTIASRIRSNDPVATVCKPCANNTVSDDGISCYVPCKQTFNGDIPYDLSPISTIEFHGSKLFTKIGSGYFHVFNTSICGDTSVTCAKTPSLGDSSRSLKQMGIESKLCRMGVVPDSKDNVTSVAYIDDFGEELLNISLWTSKLFPALRSDYNLNDITLVFRTNASTSQSTCSERITYLSLRCDYVIDDNEKTNSPVKYKLQTPNDCATGTCDGCKFNFLLRTPLACPLCDTKSNGFRTFIGPCKFGRQEVRKVPYPYCSHNLIEEVENRRCSILSIEVQIIIVLFILIAGILVAVVIVCWRRNRKLEYRYMQLVENTNPDDDTPVDNVCAQLSDEEDSGDEVQFKKQSRAKKIMNVVRKAIRKNPTNGQSESFGGDSLLLTNTSTNEA